MGGPGSGRRKGGGRGKISIKNPVTGKKERAGIASSKAMLANKRISNANKNLGGRSLKGQSHSAKTLRKSTKTYMNASGQQISRGYSR
jgi:ribosomal protein L28